MSRRLRLARYRLAHGDLDEAARHAYRAPGQSGEEDLLGPDHPEVAVVVHNLGVLPAARGRPGEATACHARAQRVARGSEHRAAATIRADG